MLVKHQGHYRAARTILKLVVLTTTALCLPYPLAHAQSDDITGLVNAFEPDPPARNVAAAAGAQPDQFRAAERALADGFSRSGNPTLSFPDPAQVREVVNTKPVQPQPSIRRVKSAVDDSAFLDGEDISTRPLEQEEARPTRPVIQEQKATTKPVKAQAPKDSSQHEQLARAEAQVRELERQLGESKSQLAAAELEISRLSAIVQSNSRARLNLPEQATSVQRRLPEQQAVTAPRAAAKVEAPRIQNATAHGEDLQVATVTVEKADLRLGPGKNHSALMSLRRGSRLAIEARQGDWYRVFAPNGQRAWIHSSLIHFGDGAVSQNDGSAVKIRGYDGKLQ